MADQSRNPGDNAELRRLEAALEQTTAELKAELAQAREERTQARQTEERQGASAQREAQARRARTAGRTAADVPDTEVAPQDLERGAAARERGARAARDTAEFEKQQNSVLRERAALPPAGGTSGGYFGGVTPEEARMRAEMAGLQTGAAGGGGHPGAPPVVPVPAQAREAASLRESIGGYQRQAAAERGVAEATVAMDAELAQSIQMQAQASNAMRRHGALTTEFFDALARGEVTLAELRYQLGSTIAKFGGWTAASVAVFGVIDAFRELGKGAIDSASGVNQVSRYINNLDTDKAQQQLVDLSRQFNLPISQVSDAMARMGQVFQNQNDALEATKAVLYGVKIGDLDVADSTRYLIAIVQGAHLPASQLATVFDQINTAQNRYGVTIRDAAAGTAKATGAWTAAGGSLRQLLALITTGQRVTGRSGEDIGTALQRSAEVVFRRPINKKTLQQYGISTAQSLSAIWDQAFELVSSGKVRGRQVNALAAGLSTPQLAPRVSAILQNRQLYDRVFASLDPTRPYAQGGAKGSAAQELHTQLQSAHEQVTRLGTDLQQIGAELARAGAGAGAMLLLKTLDLVLHSATEILAAFNDLPKPLREATTLMLEIYAAGRLLNRFGVGGAVGSILPGGQQRVADRAAARAPVTFYEGQLERATTREAQARLNAALAAERVTQLDAQGLAGGERMNRAITARVLAEEAAADASLDTAAIQRRLNAARAGVNLEAVAAAGAAGRGGGGAAGAGAGAEAEAAAAGRAGALGVNLLPQAENRLGQATGVTRRIADRLGPFGASIAGLAQRANLMSEEGSSLIGPASSNVGRLRGQLGGLTATLRGFLSDPFFAGFAAYFAAEAIKSHFDAQGRKYDQYGAGPRSQGEADQLLRTRDTSDQAQQAANLELEIRQRQAEEAAAGKPIAQLFTSQIRGQAGKTLEKLKQGVISRDQAVDELNKELKEIGTSRSSDAQKKLATFDLTRMKLAIGPAKGQSLAQIWDDRTNKEFQQQLQQDTLAITSYGYRRARLQDVAAAYQTALHRARKSPTAYNIQRLEDAQQAVDKIVQDINSDLDAALKFAGGGADRNRLFEQAINRARQLPRGQQRSLAVKGILDKQYQDWQQRLDAQTDLRVGAEIDPARAVQDQINSVGQEIEKALGLYGRGSSQVLALMKKRQDLMRQRAEAQVSLIESQGAIAVAGQTTAGGRAGAQLASDERQLAAMRSSGVYKRNELNQQVAKVLQDKQDLAQAVADDAKSFADSVIDLQEAGTTDPVKIAQDEVKRARMHLRYSRTPTDRNEAKAEVKKNQQALVDARAQSRLDDITFEADMGQITKQTEIGMLQGLLHMSGLTKEFKRNVMRQIKSVQDELNQGAGGFDVNIGNIRLPTVYEVRRAIQGARQGAQQVVVNHKADVRMEVTDGADVQAVFAEVDRQLGTSTAASARSAGLIG